MKICIDPGHGNGNQNGGYDPGAISAGETEAEIALTWALTGQWMCGQFGVPVFLTRTDDRALDPLETRAIRAKNAGATHFISIHCNAGPLLARGTEAFYRNQQGYTLARYAYQAATINLKLPGRGIKNENQIISDSNRGTRLAVLNFEGPATLLELGFITNPLDRKALKNRDNRVGFWRDLISMLRA